MMATWNDDGWNKCVLAKDDLGPRADDLRVLRDIFGVKVVWFAGFDTSRNHPDYIPSGKPMRTHQIDAKPVPWFHTSPSADYLVLDRVRENWNRDGMRAFEEAVHRIQWQRRSDADHRVRWNWSPSLLDYMPGDFSAGALAAYTPEVLTPDPPPMTFAELRDALRPVVEEAAARLAEREAAEEDGSVHTEWVVEWDDPRGRGIETWPLVFSGTRTEALVEARKDQWWPDGISVRPREEWFASSAGEEG